MNTTRKYYVLRLKENVGSQRKGEYHLSKYVGDEYSDSYEHESTSKITAADTFDTIEEVRKKFYDSDYALACFDAIEVVEHHAVTRKTRKVPLGKKSSCQTKPPKEPETFPCYHCGVQYGSKANKEDHERGCAWRG